jgi:hypothetical protein
VSIMQFILLLADTLVHSDVNIYAKSSAKFLIWHTNTTARTCFVGDTL